MSNEEKIINMLAQQTTVLGNVVTKLDGLEAKFGSLEARFGSLEARFDGLEARLDSLEARFDSLEAKVDNLEAIITETKDRVVLIENDHGQKLGALFDGYKLLFDMMGKLRASFDRLESEQEKHGFLIRWQEASMRKSG